MLCLLALSAFLLRDAGDDVQKAANTCLPDGLLPLGVGLQDLPAVFSALEACMASSPLIVKNDSGADATSLHQYRFLHSPTRLNWCCSELTGKIATVAFHVLHNQLKLLDETVLAPQLLELRAVLGFRFAATASYVAESAVYLRQRLNARLASAARLCQHSRSAADVKFAAEHYVHGEIRAGSEPVTGIVLRDANGMPYALKSVQCDGFQERNRGNNTDRCRHCRDVAKKVQNARNGKERVCSPQLKRKLSFADHSYVKNLRNTNSALRKKVKKLSARLQALLAKTGCPAYTGSDPQGTATVTLRPSEAHELVSSLLKVIMDGRLPRDSWLYRDIYHNVMATSKKDLRGLRYSPEQIAYWQSMRFLGGSRIIDQMRGPINEGAGNKGGHLPNDATRARRYVPSNSTLNAHSALLELYPKIAAEAASLARALAEKKTPAVGGISFDAITISRGYTYVEHVALLVGAKSSANGGSGAIRLTDIKKHTLEQLRDMVGTHVLQLFWTSLDGKASMPIGYIVTQGDDPAETAGAVSTAIDALAQHGIQTVFTSSDGFIGCAEFIRRMDAWASAHPTRPKDLPLVHVFDYVHVLKCIRNRLLNVGFTLANGTTISMKDLARIWLDAAASSQQQQQSDEWRRLRRELFNLVKEDDVVPSDKMNWAAVKNLFLLPDKLRQLLPTDPTAGALALFFNKMNDYYDVFSGNKAMTAAERLAKLDETVKWFLDTPRNGIGLTDELVFSLRSTAASLHRLVAWQEHASNLFWPSHTAHAVFSFLSTNVVENFFSIIRSKFRYPSLVMYATAYHAAYRYLVWRLAPDSGCPQFKAPIGMAYGNVEGIAFSFKTDVRHWSPSEKEAAIKITYVENISGISGKEEHDQHVQAALEIAARLRPTRKLLTIREATCKKRPGRCHLVLCEAKGCPRMFTYAAAYQTHKTRCHPELLSVGTATVTEVDNNGRETIAMEDDVGNDPVTLDSAELDWAVVVVDVESTGRAKSTRITQLAARTASGSSVFNELVKPPPGTVWEAGAVRVTGINTDTVKQAQPFGVVIGKFMSWLERLNCDHVLLIAHNASFDRARFAYEFSLLPGARSLPPSNWHWADSLALARSRFGTAESNSLEAVCGAGCIPSELNPTVGW